MRQSSLLFSIGILLCIFAWSSVIANSQTCTDKGEGRGFVDLSSGLDNNFENGGLQPWIEESTTNVEWKIENNSSPWEPNNPSPHPLNGQNYLRVYRGASLSFGVAVLRSPTFTLSSNEDYYFSFSSWIRSKWPQFTNLELYLAENGNEKLLSNLYNYSDITNLEWRTHSVTLSGDSSSTFSLAFYAYCGTNIEDAVAIDDIAFTSSQQSTTTPFDVTDFTTGEITTTEIPNTNTPTTSRGTLSTTTPEITSTSTPFTTTSTTSGTLSTASPEITSTSSPFPTTSPPTEFTESTPTIPTNLCDTTTTLSTPFNCPNNLEATYPDSNNPCSNIYYECSDCVATAQECPKNHIFSNQTQTCRPCAQVPSCPEECKN